MTAATPTAPRRARTDQMTSAWMVAALVTLAVALVDRHVLPQPLWTMIHVVALGVLTNAILQWSWYFARALLHLPAGGRAGASRSVAVGAASDPLAVAADFVRYVTDAEPTLAEAAVLRRAYEDVAAAERSA